MKKFRSVSDYRIDELEVIKETEKQVVFIENNRESREAKRSDYASWHDTKEEAREVMINRQRLKIEGYQRQIKYCEEHIEKIKLL